MDISSLLEKLTGKAPLKKEILTDIWEQWYKGNVADFHNYNIRTRGDVSIPCKRNTLNMPKKVCEDWANLLLNEKTDVAISGEDNQAILNRLLNYIKFWQKGNLGIELSFALGLGAFVEGVTADGKPKIQFVNRKKIYPLTIEDDEITECAFVNVNSNKVTIQAHLKDSDGNYEIRTYQGTVKDNQNLDLDFVNFYDNASIFKTESNIAWYQLIKPNIANNININSPLGISVFANALDVLKGIDLSYDGFCTEMQFGKARIFADIDLTTYDGNGEHKEFDERDILFYTFKGADGSPREPLKFYNPQLRSTEFYSGINNTLNVLSAKVGFGENHYRFDGGSLSTATQVISENSEMFRTLKKHEILLNDVIIGAVRALIYICNKFGDGEFKFSENVLNENIEVKFDDSIIEDKESQKASDRTDINSGVMSKAEYRSKWFNEDLETADDKIKDIAKENATALISILYDKLSKKSSLKLLEEAGIIENAEEEIKELESESIYKFDLGEEDDAGTSTNRQEDIGNQ